MTDNTVELQSGIEVRSTRNVRYLASIGYRRTGQECPDDDCNGILWYDSHELVCGGCGYVIDMEERRRERSSERDGPQASWEHFWEKRPTYYSSGTKRCPGGFLEPYDWTTSDEVDGAVKDVKPTEFYE